MHEPIVLHQNLTFNDYSIILSNRSFRHLSLARNFFREERLQQLRHDWRALLQVTNFQKVSFVYGFSKEFEQKFYLTVKVA